MWSIMSNIFNLLENFVDIINNKDGLIIGAKYHSSNMNDVCTMSLYDIVGCPVKVILLTTFFFNSKCPFCMTFVLATGWLTWGKLDEACLKYNVYNEYIY